ncbi:MAG: cyanophycin synthetase [Calditrichaeota bacterium]|nr:cyanophycin synthetase [Calditrichota bacterium]
MKILSSNVYVGPNLYAHFPVIRHVIDLGILEDWPSVKIGLAFIKNLQRALPGLQEHGCSYGEAGGFIRRLTEDEGTWMGHILEHVAIELQNIAGVDVTFGKTRSAGKKGIYNMVYEYQQKDVGLEAGRIARELLISLLPKKLKDKLNCDFNAEFEFETERDDFIRFAQRRELGPSTASLVKAAKQRNIPYLRLNKYSLVQFGHGKYQQRIQATITSETKHIAVEISCDKEETHNILNDLGLPVPKQELVYTKEGALRAAKRIGYPVVIKPLDANHGRGVTIDINDDELAASAFDVAIERGSGRSVIVESFITGLDHRMLVVNGKLIAVAKRVPGHVIGDGKHTVQELVDSVNSDPRRGIGHEKVLTKIEIDYQATRLIHDKGYELDTVLKKGELLYLRSTANLSTGGTAVDVTDIVHPDNKDMAVRAIKAIGLDVGGVDFLTEDISKSYKDQGGAIVEVNAAPGFRMHVAPSEGKARDVAGPVMDMLFTPGSPTRIPIAAITGTNGKTTTARMLAHILKTAGHIVGCTSTEGLFIDGQLTVKGDMTGPTSARMVLRDPSVDAAVMETARGGLLRSGLGYSSCDVAACLNISEDHLGLKGVNTLEELAEVKRIIIEVARNTAVLNADDEHCLKMAAYTQAENLCYVTMNSEHDLVREHIRSGGRAVVLEKGINGEMITIFEKGAHIPILWTHLIPSTIDGKATHNVQNAMFATALAFSMGKSLEEIRQGLQTFTTTFYQTPGRMNIFDELPFKVILDYAHNPAAIESMCNLVDRLDVRERRICILSAPGDRRDQDIRKIAELAAGHFDYYITKADDNRRRRSFDEVPKMLQEQLIKSGVKPEAIEVIPDEVEAINAGLRMGKAGDLLIIFGDNTSRCWAQITNYNYKTKKSTSMEDRNSKAIEAEHAVVKTYVQDMGHSLIRDERGVRLAKEEDD